MPLSTLSLAAGNGLRHCLSKNKVGCIQILFLHLEPVPTEAVMGQISEETGEDTTLTFAAFYLSIGRVLVQTVADGDCAFDTIYLMLSERRHREERQSLRHVLGELTEHNGLFELVDAGALLLVDDRVDDGVGFESRDCGGVVKEARRRRSTQ